ncbi:MFS transporter [Parahaliea sp. F7430]|uniref:MFS transporter n=1 Tax=Sediminihaliea albiluteola TaxID=2758564 RepID=A0A7W2TX06_9GAMM|nr:MFS transporter [Sediminihaliea albiluteola]MBA6413477.1 MFS transporter [Sediminihaliea albiluteola]
MISTKTRLMYGSGGAVYAAKEAAYTMFVLLFYTQVLGLSGTVTGLVIALSLVWDGISDPLVGLLSDRLRSRWGRRHPFMVLSIVPLGLGFIGLFSPPQAVLENSTALATWLLFWSLWLRTFVTTFSIPHLALSAEITSDYHDRSQVLGARMAFVFLFSVLLPATALLLIFPANEGVDGRFVAANYPLYGALSCAVVWVAATISSAGTRQHIHSSREAPVPRKDSSSLVGLKNDLMCTLRNRSFRLVIVYEFAAMSSYGAIASLNMLAWTYFWEFSAQEISIILSLPSILGIVLVLLTLKPLSQAFPKHRLMQFALIGMIVDCLWLYPPKLAGLLPDNESSSLAFILNFIFMMIFMYCFLLRGINTQSLVADITDEHELDQGLRQEAGFFSMINFTNKAATVVGPLYGGIALDIIGLNVDMRPGSVPQETLDGLVYALGLGVIPPLLIALALACRISMSEAKVREIQAALRQRKSVST